jgi:hypothetical protein
VKKKILIAAVLLGAMLYGGDYVALRCRPKPFGSVQVRRLYAVKMRNRQTQYLADEAQSASCVNSLLPQMGYAPCWYLTRHRVQTIDINAGRRDMLLHTP